MSDVEIVCLGFDDPTLPARLRAFKREPGMSWGNPEGTRWLFACVGGKDVGVVALSPMQDGSIRCKSDVVLPAYRRRGIYHQLCQRRLQLIEQDGVSKATAFCGDLSIGQYLKDGFRVVSVSKRGVSFMVKSI